MSIVSQFHLSPDVTLEAYLKHWEEQIVPTARR